MKGNKNMKRMYSEEELREIIKKETSLDAELERAVDLSDLPQTQEGNNDATPYLDLIYKIPSAKWIKYGDMFLKVVYTYRPNVDTKVISITAGQYYSGGNMGNYIEFTYDSFDGLYYFIYYEQ